MPESTDHYRTLQVHPEAEPEVVVAAYRRLCRKYHPDINPSPDAAHRMTAINAAYEVLSDPQRRAEHDRQHRGRPGAVAPQPPAPPRPQSRPETPGQIHPRLALSLSRIEIADAGRASFEIFNLGGGQLTGTVSTPSAWLRVAPTNFTANRTLVSVEAVGEGFASGRDREGYIFVTTNGGTAAVTVHVFGANAAARLDVEPHSLLLGSVPGGFRSTATLRLANSGRAPLSGTVRSTSDWLRYMPAVFAGTGVEVRVSADFDRLAPGLDHYASLLIESNGGVVTIPVQAFVYAAHAAAV